LFTTYQTKTIVLIYKYSTAQSIWTLIDSVAAITLCKSSPVTGLECPRGFQKVKVPRFHDSGTGWW